MKRIAVLAGVLAIAVAAPASAEPVVRGGGLLTAQSTGTPAAVVTEHAETVTATSPAVENAGVTPGRGMETALSAQTPGVTP